MDIFFFLGGLNACLDGLEHLFSATTVILRNFPNVSKTWSEVKYNCPPHICQVKQIFTAFTCLRSTPVILCSALLLCSIYVNHPSLRLWLISTASFQASSRMTTVASSSTSSCRAMSSLLSCSLTASVGNVGGSSRILKDSTVCGREGGSPPSYGSSSSSPASPPSTSM